MSFDGIFTHLMVNELSNTLTNGRLSKVHQPYDNELMLVFRNNSKNHTLLLSANPNYARIQLTNIKYKNPATPPNFCMTLRKYLEGSILQEIKQTNNDRIISFSFESRNDLGDLESIVLIVELMGRHSNIILLNKDTQKIIDTIKHVGMSQNSYRLLLPGADYITPPLKDTQNPWTVDKEALFKELNSLAELSTQAIQQQFEGFSKDTANELVYRLKHEDTDKVATWTNFFNEMTNQLHPTIGLIKEKESFTPIPYQTFDEELSQFDTLSDMLDAFYEGKVEKDRVKQQAGELIKKVTNDINKLKKKTKILEKQLVDADNAEIYRVKGELLTTFLHEVKRGATSVELPNYYDNDEPIKISLNEALTPNQNAQKYFQRYQKLKNGVAVVKEQLNITKYELLYLESVLAQLDIASPSDVQLIREELIAEKYIKVKNKDKKKQKNKPSKPLQFVSSDGDTIFVGKNNIQNDQLTLKTANKNDIWLHTKDIPGSHVIIKNSNPSDQTLLEAALLAAYYSKYRLSASVPVDYVAVKHVKKPNGAKPGFVIYENQKTLFVTPELSEIKKIKGC
ncbi:NFACT RNA binding domain-containing protein [Vagococcus teuberi]